MLSIHGFGQSECHARNVIIMIGDGMGLSQVSYLMYNASDTTVFERLPVIGLQKTHPSSGLITDSGAAATAMACGIKTYNNAIGCGPDSLPRTSLFELAALDGKRTGVVVTSSIVHATPASFYAHQKLRGMHESIAVDLLHSGVDYIAGGGQIYFTNRYGDDRNLLEELEVLGYFVSGYDRKTFGVFSKRIAPKMVYITAYTEPLPVMQGREALSDMVSHALEVLTTYDSTGFVLLVEGSQIDYAGHSKDAGYLLSELRDFEEAIGTAHRFAKDRDDTLLLVTGDHETGMMKLTNTNPGKRVQVEFQSGKHTASMVPVFAYGPCAQRFAGLYENTEIFTKVVDALGLSRE